MTVVQSPTRPQQERCRSVSSWYDIFAAFGCSKENQTQIFSSFGSCQIMAVAVEVHEKRSTKKRTIARGEYQESNE